ncbi:hypothetical protein C2S53_000262 [Perilla frutescens var. hirtella]|uniref:Glutaredoxin domain-containing protein n=1 Tax=Perilla frutescens var. hirtella TaxID=608512 RepID=A0AAD4JAM6_PERFH|nr:hypothetical protein C2S53_000262 [Perilla frutescens var. hirtella]
MGCATSKQKVCRKCQAPYSPVRRSYSMHVHHPPQKTGDSYHLVALTSSTLGSLKLDPLIQNHAAEAKDINVDAPLNQSQNQSAVEDEPSIENGETDKRISAKEEFAMGMIEAKTWSNMIDGKIPKIPPRTPVRTPPGEPEMIDAWEMMEGLEGISPLRPAHLRSFSFHVASSAGFSSIDDQPTPRVKENDDGDCDGEVSSPKPGWLDSGDTDSSSNSNDTSIVSEFDPDMIATFRRALEELPPANPFHLNQIDDCAVEKTTDKVGKDKLVVYFTSLRGVRKTYEDCCHVRVILKGLGVKVDERDVSMHSRFKEELKELLAEGSGGIGLPSVFLGGKCIGGADEIRRLNEEGMLEKTVENCELVDDGGSGGGGGGNGGVCEACGDVRDALIAMKMDSFDAPFVATIDIKLLELDSGIWISDWCTVSIFESFLHVRFLGRRCS